MRERNGDRRRLWGLRSVALALALGLWFGISLSSRDAPATRELEGFISYLKSEDVILMGRRSSVRVTVSGPEDEIRSLLPDGVVVEVDLRDESLGPLSVGLSPEDVILPPDLSVTSIDPNVLYLELEQVASQTLPLEASFTGEPAAGARVLVDQVEIEPSEVQVSGPASIVESLTKLDLSPISLEGHAITFETRATVLSPDPLVQVQSTGRVQVQVPMDLGPGGGLRGSGNGGTGADATGNGS